MSLKIDKEKLGQNIDEVFGKVMAVSLMYADTQASHLRSYMQTHRPWRDRTGEAKRRLNAQVSQPNDHTIRLTLSQGVDYGFWLEMANEKKYAIVQPTLETKSQEVVAGFEKLMDKIGVGK